MSAELQNVANEQHESLVVFKLAHEFYGVGIGSVNTIIRMQNVTHVPGSSDFVEGIINLRGSIIPVIDLRRRFGFPSGEVTKASRIVVIDASGEQIGMIVDAVVETLTLSAEDIEQPPTTVKINETEFVRGVAKQEDRLVILLDLTKIFTESAEVMSDMQILQAA